MYTIALGIDRNYLLPALVTLTSVATATPPPVRADIVVSVTSSDLTPMEARTVRDVVKRLGFGHCQIRSTRTLAGVRVPHGSYITPATYLRFALHEASLMPSFLLYLDADLIVLDDLTDGFDHLRAPGTIGVVGDEIVQRIGNDEALPGFVDAFPEHAGKPYYNAGAIWMAKADLPRFRAGALRQLHQHTRFIYFNDQDALNLWLLHARCAAPLPDCYNRFELDRLRERSDWLNDVVGPARSLTGAKIVHFIGSRKPWFRSCPHTSAVRTYLAYLTETRQLVRRLGDLTLDVPRAASP